MKKMLLLFMSALALVSCSLDDENNDPIVEEATLVGTWSYSGTTGEGEPSPSDCDKDRYVLFNADGTGVENAVYHGSEGCYLETHDFLYTTSEGIMKITVGDFPINLPYEIKENTLVFEYGSFTASYTKN